MPHLPAHSPGRANALPLPVAGIGSERGGTDEASRPALVHDQQRPAVVVVFPTQGVGAVFAAHLPAPEYAVWVTWTGTAALELAEGLAVGVLVLDLDGQYAVGHARAMISGARLLALLGRLIRGRPVAIVVLTCLDYAEVEGLVRAYADDLIHPLVPPAHVLGRIRAALARARTRHQQGGAATPAPLIRC